MDVNSLSAGLAAAACVAVASGALARKPRNLAKWVFAGGLGLLAAEMLCLMASADAAQPEVVTRWQRLRLFSNSLVPGTWLLFSLVFARGNSEEFLQKWRGTLAAAFALPVACAFFGLAEEPQARLVATGIAHEWVFDLSRWSMGVYLALLVGTVMILLNMEQTFREAVGTLRWRIKYVVLGVCLLFAMRLYTSSQALLYRVTSEPLGAIDSVVLVLACLLIGFGFLRFSAFNVDVYPSHAILRNAITIVMAGGYLFVVGVIAMVVKWRGGMVGFHLKALYFLIALVLLAVLLLSDRIRLRISQFVSRHLRRSRFDYREIWRTFTEKTAAQMKTDNLCRAVATWVSANLDTLSVTIWLVDESGQRIIYGASTAVAEPGGAAPALESIDAGRMLAEIVRNPEPVNLDATKAPWAAEMRTLHPAFFPKGGSRFCVPMVCRGQPVGLMTLGDRVRGVPFTHEELDLLKCIGEQAASALMNLRLSEKLLENRELEAFQTMSTFFVHDLKNTVSTLSLTLQNLPRHFADPAFREDALRGIGKSVNRMQQLIGQLTLLRQKLEIRPVMADLNEVVAAALDALPAGNALPLVRRLQPVPKTLLDPEQMQKVILNLVLNAKEALNGAGGQIDLSTRAQDDCVELAVSDNGCGMSPEFLHRSLFRPFQTTKKNGTGIGMFHSKMIVEAHRGRFEVASEPGKGSTFRIILPIVAK